MSRTPLGQSRPDDTWNVTFYYQWKDGVGPVGIPTRVALVKCMTVKELEAEWILVAAARGIDLSDKELISVQVRV